MKTLVLPTLLALVPLLALGQTDSSGMKVLKSAPIEMKAVGAVQSSSVSSSTAVAPPLISGDFTVSSAHPSCASGGSTEERTRCTAEEVLRHLLGQPMPGRPKKVEVIILDFDVDEYGYVKAIRTNSGTEPELGKALIVGLSSLPKFEGARKGEARATSHCGFSYTVDELFPAMTAPTATAAVPPAVASTTEAPAASGPTVIKSGDHLITGVFTSPSAHPACAHGKPGAKAGIRAEEQLACTAEEVLKRIRATLKAEAPAYMDVMVIDFDIDEYGDVKTIRANCASEPELGKAVIVALYGMPQFVAAKKDGARARSHCTFHYPVAELFTKP